MRSLLVGVLLLSACAKSNQVECGNDVVCPPNTQCVALDTTAGSTTICATPTQVGACNGQDPLAECGPNMRCYSGVCLAAGCGNALIDPGEVCDDGNTQPGDLCSSDCSSEETCGNGVIDVIRGEQCDDGPTGAGLSHDGCSSACQIESPIWTPIEGIWSGSSAHAAYDVDRRRTVAVVEASSQMLTWEFDGHHWEPRTTARRPPPRSNFGMVYDTARARVVLFGGTGFDDTWEWDGTDWTQINLPVHPSPRGYMAMTYDPVHRRVVMFGGSKNAIGAGTDLDDTWAYDGTTWTELPRSAASPPPSPRSAAAMAFDPRRGSVVLFGGAVDPINPYGDTWELRGDTWVPLVLTGPTPEPSYKKVFAYDPRIEALVLAGGTQTGTGVWTFDGTAWTSWPTSLQVYATASLVSSSEGALLINQGSTYVWDATLATPAWTPLQPFGIPLFRVGASATFDPIRQRAYIVGGTDTSTSFLEQFNGTFVERKSTPAGHVGTAIAFDSARDQAVIFGGTSNNVDYATTFIFDPATQTVTDRTASIAQSPPARWAHALAYDPARNQTVLFGGQNGGVLSGTVFDDTWLWNGVTWSQVDTSASPHPSARDNACFAYDPLRQRLVLFGGYTPDASSGVTLGDTWEWDGQTWSPKADGPARFSTNAAWDPARKRLVVTAGSTNASGFFSDAWEWDGTAWSSVASASFMPERYGHVTFSSPRNGGVMITGGAGDNYAALRDAWWLHWTSASPDETCDATDRDHDGLVACADPDCWWTCTPLCMPGMDCTTVTGPRCGDGTCNAATESCVTCPGDCGACPAYCGDATCDAGESVTSCPGDCTP